MNLPVDIHYIGVNDHEIDLFEGQYKVPSGMAYNSYVLMDQKIAVLDTVDRRFTHEWLDNVAHCLGTRKPDYLIIQHMEPDHSANIEQFLRVYPETTHGALAGGHANLRFDRRCAFFGRCFRQIRRIGCHGGLGLRGTTVLFWHCRKVRRTGAGPAEKSGQPAHPNDLPAPWPGFAGKPRLLPGAL